MADKLYNEASIQAIADAIRAKSGKTDTMKVSEMAGEIAELGKPDWDGLASGSWPSGEATLSTTTTIPAYKFQNFTGITDVVAPSLTSIGNYGFQSSRIRSIDAPLLTTIGSNAFQFCYWFGGGYFPEVTTINGSAFYNDGTECDECIFVFPKVTTLSASAFRQIRGKTVGAIVDLGEGVSSLPNYTFYNSGKAIQILILRKSDTVVTTTSSNSIGSISATETTVYVPSALISEYTQATNWSTKGSIFQAIEGSIYETQYADGTPIETGGDS